MMKRLLSLMIAAALASCAVLSGCSGAGGTKSAESTPLPHTEGATQEHQSIGILSFTVRSDAWSPAADGNAIIKIEGTTESGTKVSEQYEASSEGQKYLTDLEAGTYAITLVKAGTGQDGRLFKATSTNVIFDGEHDKNAVLVIELDAAAMEKAAQAAAEKKAAEERAAQAAQEAEAARIAQEQAAAAEAQAAAEAAAAAEAEAAAAAEDERTVYVAASGKGKKYHSDPSCSNMKGTRSLSISEAESMGYTPCKKCY